MELFLSALGLAMVIEGLPYLAFPKKIKELAKILPEQPNGLIQTFGFVIVGGGLILIYLARHFF
jgi:uncharacterized protein YjeT (DUF2065 family)